jgi:hypothetical protein
MPELRPGEPNQTPSTAPDLPTGQHRWRPNRIALAAFIGIGLICVLLAVANLPAAWWAERDAASFINGCAHLRGTTVTLDAFAVPRAATGSVHGVRGHIDQASIGGLRIDDITADIPAATFSAWRLALGSHRIDLRQARITATVTPTDLTDFLQANGFPVTVRFDPSQPIILVSADLVPLQLPLAVSVDNGAIAVEADPGPGSLPHIHVSRLIRLPGVNVTDIGVVHDILIVHATLNGNPATPTCALHQSLTTVGLIPRLLAHL